MLGLLAFRGYGNRLGGRPTEHAPAAAARKLDLNRADRTELEQVDGIGPKLARAIDDHRREKGQFRSVDDLNGVHGFGPKTVDKVRPFVRVESPPAEPPVPEPLRLERKPTPPPAATTTTARKLRPGDPPIDVNAATAEELQQLDGIGPKLAQAIIETRAASPFTSPDDLKRVKGIGAKTMDKVRPFVVVK
jgi:competence protein ComEA